MLNASSTRCPNRLGEAAEGEAMHIHAHPNGHLARGGRPLEWRVFWSCKTPAQSLFSETPVERSASNRWLRLFSQPNRLGCDWRLEFDRSSNIAAAASWLWRCNQPNRFSNGSRPPPGTCWRCVNYYMTCYGLLADRGQLAFLTRQNKKTMELHQTPAV